MPRKYIYVALPESVLREQGGANKLPESSHFDTARYIASDSNGNVHISAHHQNYEGLMRHFWIAPTAFSTKTLWDSDGKEISAAERSKVMPPTKTLEGDGDADGIKTHFIFFFYSGPARGDRFYLASEQLAWVEAHLARFLHEEQQAGRNFGPDVIQAVKDKILMPILTDSHQTATKSILLEGPAGVGKNRLARFIHKFFVSTATKRKQTHSAVRFLDDASRGDPAEQLREEIAVSADPERAGKISACLIEKMDLMIPKFGPTSAKVANLLDSSEFPNLIIIGTTFQVSNCDSSALKRFSARLVVEPSSTSASSASS